MKLVHAGDMLAAPCFAYAAGYFLRHRASLEETLLLAFMVCGAVMDVVFTCQENLRTGLIVGALSLVMLYVSFEKNALLAHLSKPRLRSADSLADQYMLSSA